MLKELIVGAAAVAAGLIPFAGQASADPAYAPGTESGDSDTGLILLDNLDVVHNLNANLGVCDNNINILGVQVPIQDSFNGLDIPILSPGPNEAEGATPENCATSENTDGGTYQGD